MRPFSSFLLVCVTSFLASFGSPWIFFGGKGEALFGAFVFGGPVYGALGVVASQIVRVTLSYFDVNNNVSTNVSLLVAFVVPTMLQFIVYRASLT